MYEFLRKIPLFSSLAEEDLARLCEMAEIIKLPVDAQLFEEGEMGEWAYVIQEGQIEILKTTGGRKVQLAIRTPGEVIGEMALLESAPRMASARARTDSILIAISQEQLDRLLNTSPSAARAMLHTFTSRLRSTEIMLRQSEKMAQLGTLSAGMAHELNNPAAAALRGSESLQQVLSELQKSQNALFSVDLDDSQIDILTRATEEAIIKASQVLAIDPLDRSDREAELEEWLDDHQIADAWEYAPALVNFSYSIDDLEKLNDQFSEDQLPAVLSWMITNYSAANLIYEISMGARQISEIVKSMKTYVYLDQAPVQEVDLQEGLENTLVILRSKLKKGITIHRDYAANLPKIQAYGSELNQVWTNIIDNAVDAMNGEGDLWLRTWSKQDWVVVEIEDTGPGMPEEVQAKIFTPFFTTKPVGKGTGLGLNITYNIVQKHAGEIKVNSRPGKTTFQVYLPFDFNNPNLSTIPSIQEDRMNDQFIVDILQKTKTIAVVGISNRPEAPAYSVPAYLQSQGYTIIPVNPTLSEVLGEKAFPNLSAVTQHVDVVLIFRRSEAVPEIVEEAIKIGADTIWMQEGIVNEAAAQQAQDAGRNVIMDKCMRQQHKRLIAQ